MYWLLNEKGDSATVDTGKAEVLRALLFEACGLNERREGIPAVDKDQVLERVIFMRTQLINAHESDKLYQNFLGTKTTTQRTKGSSALLQSLANTRSKYSKTYFWEPEEEEQCDGQYFHQVFRWNSYGGCSWRSWGACCHLENLWDEWTTGSKALQGEMEGNRIFQSEEEIVLRGPSAF